MKLNVFNNSEEAIVAISKYFIALAKDAIAKNGVFNVSLSGGSSPKKLYELLANEYSNEIDWTKVYFFFGDERYVAQDHADSNYLMAYNAIFKTLNIAEKQIFKVNTSLSPAEAANAYEKDIVSHLPKDLAFDLMLLGLGDDAHTASLFPNTTIINEKEALVKDVFLTDKDVFRISMTAPLINKSKNIAFLTFGTGKAEAIKHVLEGEKNVHQYPSQLIVPENGDLQWFVDDAAVAKLSK